MWPVLTRSTIMVVHQYASIPISVRSLAITQCPTLMSVTTIALCPPPPAQLYDMSAPVVHRSHLVRRFNIPSMDDISKWDQSWGQVLGGFSTSEDIFAILKDTWKPDQQGSSALSDLPERIRKRVLRSQAMASKLLYELDLRDFSLAYGLMKDEQIKEHYFNGLKEACAQSSLQEDARALCPEITTSLVSKRLAFKFFLGSFRCGVALAGEGNLAILHSDWWNAAVKMPEPWPEDVRFAFAQLTLQRNEFISESDPRIADDITSDERLFPMTFYSWIRTAQSGIDCARAEFYEPDCQSLEV